jgi:acyl carrier protein
MEALKEELKNKIITTLNLEDIVEDIADNDPLFGDGLGLDSIDALELIVILDKDYGIKLVDPKEGKQFSNLSKLWRLTSALTELNFFRL